MDSVGFNPILQGFAGIQLIFHGFGGFLTDSVGFFVDSTRFNVILQGFDGIQLIFCGFSRIQCGFSRIGPDSVDSRWIRWDSEPL